MWLVGVVIRRYIDILIIIINFPYSTCIRSFFGSSILNSLFIFKMVFFSLVSVIFLQYLANVNHRTFEIILKNRDPRIYKNYLIISIIKDVERASTARVSPETSMFDVRNQVRMTFDRCCQLTLCIRMAS